MYAVIFKARINKLDSQYQATAKRLRELATREFACRDFFSVTENDFEISISYWDSLDDIQAWRDNQEHFMAQAMGASRWYRSVEVDVVELIRNYQRDYQSH
jgi:heme-degrading monooxygenase HmoA